MGASLVYLDRP